jgi:hypothetical protein
MVSILAHLVSTGVGPFYDGALHFFLSFEDLLPGLALSLLSGLRGPRAGRMVVAVLPLAWVAGGTAGLENPIAAPPPAVTLALLGVPAALAAWDRELPLFIPVLLAAFFGLWCGFWNGAAMAVGSAGLRAVLGAASSVLLVAVLAAAAVVSLRAGWTRIVLRVAGSWIAALGLLALGWTLRK